jgi:hypothetical protein
MKTKRNRVDFMCKRLLVILMFILATGFLFSTITITSPNGGETWTPGFACTVTWYSVNETGNVKLELFRYATLEGTITNSTPINSGTYSFLLPSTVTPATTYKIKITSNSNPATYDWSDAFFTITAPPSITVTDPNGGENWNIGGTYPITWDSNYVTGNVSISYIGTGDYWWTTISYDTPASNEIFNWTIPYTINPGINNFKVRVYSNSFYAIRDSSDDFFTLTQAININSPAVGVEWLTGSMYTINWIHSNITGNAVIELYQGTNTTPTTTINNSQGITWGFLNWIIPTIIPPANDYRIKITSLVTPGIYDFSPYFTISNPVGNDDPGTVPLVTALGGIYPNPFNTSATIDYSLKEFGEVAIAVYDVKGRLVRQLVQTNNPGGSFTTHWDGTDAAGKQMSNGIYYLSMQSDAYRASRKLLLLK